MEEGFWQGKGLKGLDVQELLLKFKRTLEVGYRDDAISDSDSRLLAFRYMGKVKWQEKGIV